MRTVTSIEVEKQLTETDPQFYIIDVREQDEYEAGHIPNALHIPWHAIQGKMGGIRPERHLIIYCNTGVRAKKAAHFLEQAGFANVSVYVPGWEEWERNHS